MKLLTTLLSSAVLAMAVAGTAQAEDKLRLGTEGAYAPFNTVDKDGK
ncbi:MAG: amino acid ABC transporter, partial [Thiothrix lacustris]